MTAQKSMQRETLSGSDLVGKRYLRKLIVQVSSPTREPSSTGAEVS